MQRSMKCLSSIIQASKCIKGSKNTFSTTSSVQNLVEINVDDKSGYATLTMNKPPVNSLNLELLEGLSNALDQMVDNRSRGVILTSSSDKVFSAGLDIMEMYKPDVNRAKKFWTALQDVWLKLYGSSFPTAAAINGNSPAGGCLLALCTEHRVMCKNFTIGLNETRLGIVAPTFFQATMLNVINRREAEKALTLGTMFTSEEALKIGLVDELVDTKDIAIQKCVNFLDQFKKISPEARGITKQALRAADIRNLEENRDQDVELFVFAITQKKVQKGLETYLEALKSKKA